MYSKQAGRKWKSTGNVAGFVNGLPGYMQPKGRRNLRRQNTEPLSEEPDPDPVDDKEEDNAGEEVEPAPEEVNDQPEEEVVDDPPEVNGDGDEVQEEPFEEVTVADNEEVPPELENEDGASIGKKKPKNSSTRSN